MSNKQYNPPDITDILDNLKRDIFVNLNCVKVGFIKSFDASKQIATVQIAHKKVVKEETDGTRIIKEHPLILECPVFVLQGGSSYISFPIKSGDNCILLFNDREIDNWLKNGGLQLPTTIRAHDISDAIALVGINSFNKVITNYRSDATSWLFDNDSKIEILQNQIDSKALLFNHIGNMLINGSLTITGNMFGIGGTIKIDDNIEQLAGKSIKVGNGATGTFTTNDGKTVTVEDGIVIQIV